MIKPVSCLCALVKSITLTYQSTSQIYQGPGPAWMYVVLLYLSNISIYSQVNPPPSKNTDATYIVPCSVPRFNTKTARGSFYNLAKAQ